MHKDSPAKDGMIFIVFMAIILVFFGLDIHENFKGNTLKGVNKQETIEKKLEKETDNTTKEGEIKEVVDSSTNTRYLTVGESVIPIYDKDGNIEKGKLNSEEIENRFITKDMEFSIDDKKYEVIQDTKTSNIYIKINDNGKYTISPLYDKDGEIVRINSKVLNMVR